MKVVPAAFVLVLAAAASAFGPRGEDAARAGAFATAGAISSSSSSGGAGGGGGGGGVSAGGGGYAPAGFGGGYAGGYDGGFDAFFAQYFEHMQQLFRQQQAALANSFHGASTNNAANYIGTAGVGGGGPGGAGGAGGVGYGYGGDEDSLLTGRLGGDSGGGGGGVGGSGAFAGFGAPSGSFGGGVGSAQVPSSAQASLSVSNRGGFGQASISPDPDHRSVSGAVPPLSGSGSFGVFSSASSSSSDIDGKRTVHKSATVGVNDNGKVSTFSVKER